eukprot:Em0001g3813a
MDSSPILLDATLGECLSHLKVTPDGLNSNSKRIPEGHPLYRSEIVNTLYRFSSICEDIFKPIKQHVLWRIKYPRATTNKFPYIIRVCGQRITKYGAKKRECKAFSAELKIAFDIDTSGDGVNIHPEMFCMHFPVDAKGAEVCSVLQHPLTDTGTATAAGMLRLGLPSLTPEKEKQEAGLLKAHQETTAACSWTVKMRCFQMQKIRGIVRGGEASALIEKEVLILSDEERRSLLDKAGISSSIELGQLRWLKSPGICLAGEIAVFSFTISSGGEEIKGDNVVQLVDGNERTGRLTWHKGFIPANEIWLKIGGDKGGGTFKMTFQIVNVATPNSVHNTCVSSFLPLVTVSPISMWHLISLRTR